MKKLPIGIQDFKELRTEEFLYIDKTQLIHDIVTSGKYFFLSRPRRFGKSLLISTLAEIFKGSKALFEDLWIATNWDWSQTNPVLEFRFNNAAYKEIGLKAYLLDRLDEHAKAFGISFDYSSYPDRFRELIMKISEKHGKVAVLVDEYDKPIIDYLEDLPKAEENRDILKSFYSVIKPLDANLRFVFLTGVSKFSKTSIFSELNNLKDLTMSKQFSSICGYTQDELDSYFEAHRKLLAQDFEQDDTWVRDEVKRWYNGYAWGNRAIRLYNPFSILQLYQDRQFMNYWFESGTPTFLIKLLNRHGVYDMESIQATSASFGSFDLNNISPETLLFQTGYIAIKKDLGLGLYELGYPNQEVRESMLQYLLADYTKGGQGRSAAPALLMAHALLQGHTDELKTQINALLGAIPYDLHQKNEAYYHTVMHLAFSLIGVHIQSEIHVAKGRLDCIVNTDHTTYIFEFKVDSSAQEALEQIKNNGYAQPYLGNGKPVLGIGVSFSTEAKEVTSWLVEELT
ncbi:MAG: AAA family ATPase [Flammeovirgaceae bacterium]